MKGLQLCPEAKGAYHGPAILVSGKNNFAFLPGGHWLAIFWHGAWTCSVHLLLGDGRLVVTQDDGQVCVLQLYHGNRPITLDELEALAATEGGSNHTPAQPK
jgi:hypothetical protein